MTERRRREAARLGLRTLPDRVRIAYGWNPPTARAVWELPADHPNRIAAEEAKAGYRQDLVDAGYLSADELATLPVDEAIALAVARMWEEHGVLLDE